MGGGGYDMIAITLCEKEDRLDTFYVQQQLVFTDERKLIQQLFLFLEKHGENCNPSYWDFLKE